MKPPPPIGLGEASVGLLLADRGEELLLQPRCRSSRAQRQPSPAAASRSMSAGPSTTPRHPAGESSLIATPAVFKRSTSRTWRIASSLLASSPPMASQGADAKTGQQRRRATGDYPGRHSSGIAGEIISERPSEIKSEWRARSLRIRGASPGIRQRGDCSNQSEASCRAQIAPMRPIAVVDAG